MKLLLIPFLTLLSFNLRSEINPQYIETLEIDVGHNHTCAITSAGLKCFGHAEKITTSAPILKNPKIIEAGNRFSCAADDDGIHCWGEIPNSRKNNLFISRDEFPLKILSVGYTHACAVSELDDIRCWGSDDYGEATPPPNLKQITELSLGMNNTCAIAEGVVHCWGIGLTGSTSVPVNIINPKNLTSGWWHHCVNSDEGIKCWGNPYSQYLPPDDSSITTFSSGGLFNCAIVSEGVKCWDESGVTSLVEGSFSAYKLSVGSTIGCAMTLNTGLICWKLSYNGIFKKMISYVPAGSIFDFDKIATGPGATCAYGDGGKLKCWGANFYGALNVPSTIPFPIDVLSSGWHKTCAIKNNELTCWGNIQNDYNTPKDIGPVSMVSSGGFQVCAANDQRLRCWGEDMRGGLEVPKNLTNISNISSGFTHVCAVANSEVVCWGGVGLIKGVKPANKIFSPLDLCAGGSFSCAINDSGKVQCWGEKIPLSIKNDLDPKNLVLKVPSAINGATQVTCGGSHGCALYNGKIKCWGDENFLPERFTPPAQIINPRMIRAGWNHTCALGDNGLFCWGDMIGMQMPDYSLEK